MANPLGVGRMVVAVVAMVAMVVVAPLRSDIKVMAARLFRGDVGKSPLVFCTLLTEFF